MEDLDKIKEKILRLRNMVPERGASEQEALSALEKADKMMQEHGISEDDLLTAEAKRDMRDGKFKYRFKAQHPSSKLCGVMISRFCGVISWYNPKHSESVAFGFNGDVEMYEFLIKLIHDSMDRGWKEYLAVNPKRSNVSRHTEYWSFMFGFAERINAKLSELINARKVKSDSTGTDLVEVKMAVVEKGMAEMLPDIRLRSGRSSGLKKGSRDAYGKGQAAGDKVNLNRPISSHAASGRKSIG